MLHSREIGSRYIMPYRTLGAQAVFTRSILVDGQLLKITETLSSALRGLRDRPPEHYRHDSDDNVSQTRSLQHVQLWADAICINQEDRKEKSLQVAMMARIYSMAAGTEVWLGDAVASDTLAFWMIRCAYDYEPIRLRRSVARDGFMQHYEHCYQTHRHDIREYIELHDLQNRDTLEKACFRAIAKISQRESFQRLWVVQELAVSEIAWVSCGHHTIHYNDWEHFIDAYHNQGDIWMNPTVVAEESYPEASKIFWRMEDITRYESGGRTTPADSLIDVWSDISGSRFTDERDIVYAIREFLFPEPREDLLPDYDISLQRLWQDVAMFLLDALKEGDSRAVLPYRLYCILAIPAVQVQARRFSIYPPGCLT